MMGDVREVPPESCGQRLMRAIGTVQQINRGRRGRCVSNVGRCFSVERSRPDSSCGAELHPQPRAHCGRWR